MIGSDETVRAGFVVLPIHCIAYTSVVIIKEINYNPDRGFP